MDKSEQLNNLRKLMVHFEEADKIHQDFHHYFNIHCNSLIKSTPVDTLISKDIEKDLKTFANSIINNTLEVIDKDKTLEPERIQKELEHINLIICNCPKPETNNEFTKAFSHLTKVCITEFFSDIYNLSASGFRLLDNSSKFYIYTFLIYLYNKD